MWHDINWAAAGRLLVGSVFLFSGMAKLLDVPYTADTVHRHLAALPQRPLRPLRLAVYKTPMACLLIAVEIGLGYMVLKNYKPHFALPALMVMTLSFGCLTFYVASRGKLKTCGCVGRVLTLTPWQSFFKNVFLSAVLWALTIQQFIYP